MYWIGVFKQVANKSMTRFVVSNSSTCLLIQNPTLAFRTSNNSLHGILNFLVRNNTLVATSRQNSRFVKQVRQVSTRKTRSQLSQAYQVNIVAQWLVCRMNVQNLFTTLNIRNINHDLTVKTTRTQQRWVQNVSTVGSSNQYNRIVCFEAVHFYQ